MRLSAVSPNEHERLVQLWEASMRATHTFVAEQDMAVFTPGLRDVLPQLVLVCAKDEVGQIVGFVGVSGDSVDMLFVAPQAMGAGIGRALLVHAIDALGCRVLDVYEQNLGARAFYARMGFEVEGRSEVNSLGMPYPVLHLRWRRVDGAGRRSGEAGE
jgi:putative acetyltransferase